MRRLVRRSALALAIAIVAAPAARATIPPAYDSSTEGSTSVVTPAPKPQPVTLRADGFDWADASIGASAALAVAALGALGFSRAPRVRGAAAA